MLDFDMVFYGDTSVVSYIAELFWQSGQIEGSYKLRSVDVYARRRAASWNQVASNIGPPPRKTRIRAPIPTLSCGRSRSRCALLFSKTRVEVWQAFFSNDTEKLKKLIP